MYVRYDESSLYSRINYVHSLTGNFSAGVSGNKLKRCTQGLARARIAYTNAPGADCRKKPDVMI